MTLYISHGADGEWFIVEPREGETSTSIEGTKITPTMAADSLIAAGRTVYRIEARPFTGTLFAYGAQW